jgi:hypothetical protein
MKTEAAHARESWKDPLGLEVVNYRMKDRFRHLSQFASIGGWRGSASRAGSDSSVDASTACPCGGRTYQQMGCSSHASPAVAQQFETVLIVPVVEDSSQWIRIRPRRGKSSRKKSAARNVHLTGSAMFREHFHRALLRCNAVRKWRADVLRHLWRVPDCDPDTDRFSRQRQRSDTRRQGGACVAQCLNDTPTTVIAMLLVVERPGPAMDVVAQKYPL